MRGHSASAVSCISASARNVTMIGRMIVIAAVVVEVFVESFEVISCCGSSLSGRTMIGSS